MSGLMTPFQITGAGTIVTANKNFQPYDITGMAWIGMLVFVNVTNVVGADSTLQISIQIQDPTGQSWIQIPGAISPIITSTGLTTLQVSPAISPIANQQVQSYISNIWRLVATVGGSAPSFTISLHAIYLP